MFELDLLLNGKRSVAIAGHVRPDGDCVGAGLAVYNYIREYYPQVEACLYLESVMEKYRFLKNADQILPAPDEVRSFDLFIVVDCGDLGRLGAAAKFFTAAKTTLCMDHHVSNNSFADYNIVLPDISSTCELVYTLMNKERITKEIAECLYVGLTTDTGVFQYSCTSPDSMRAGADLMSRGIDYSGIVTKTFFEKTFPQLKILGYALSKSELIHEGRLIHTRIDAGEMERFGVTPEDLDGIASEMRNTEGVEVAVFLHENRDGSYKLSLRSGSFVDVAKIAVSYGGGGHVRAAGATITDPITEAEQQILQDVMQAIDKGAVYD